LFQLISRGNFIELSLFYRELMFQPGKVFDQSCSITDMASHHAFKLGLVLDRFSVTNWTSNFFDLGVTSL